jgi:phospholipid/cholesterol/gamma-HCH transport system permease protein
MLAWEFSQRDGVAVIALSGDWIAQSEARAPTFEIASLCKARTVRQIGFDLSRLGHWNTVFVAFLWDVKRAAAAANVMFDDSTLPGSARELLRLLPTKSGEPQAAAPRPFRPLSWGFTQAISFLAEVGENAVLAVATASGSGRLILGRARTRGSDLFSDLANAGPRAVAIVGIVNFLVGAILAFIGAAELRRYAAEIYVANLVGIASVRELASVVTAIVMAGRTGGSYAARIASMRGNDEIAALRAIGIPINDFLVLPAVGSLCLTMPILYLLGCLFAVVGGLAVSTFSLGFTPIQYLQETLNAVPLGDFVFGGAKSVAFAALIGTVSCRAGLKSARSAQAVGDAATRAVVMNIVGIIALDAMFAVIMDARGV